MDHKQSNKKGSATLFSVLIVSLIGVSVSLAVVFTTLNSIRNSGDWNDYRIALENAESCAERALVSVHNDPLYTGGDTYTFDNGSCDVVDVLGTGDSDRVVNAEGTYRDAYARIQVDASTVRPQISISSWKDIADF